MGTNSGPQIANIYLFIYEYDYIKALIESNDEVKLKNLQNIFRFQDDLIAFNDQGLLIDIINDIYPTEMIVNNTNITTCKVNYLDLTVSIWRGSFLVKLYDKRKDYNFDVISYPYLDGNIPSDRSYYGVFISQLMRFCKVKYSNLNNFINDVKLLVDKLVKQGFNTAALRKKLFTFYHSKVNVWSKFGVDIYTQLSQLI